ncbi:MAG: heparinase II/III family protein, partial [Kiritimatiellae bacterium]|nr:heparinase II/III family protein [Kiritimatiellia bacterium]
KALQERGLHVSVYSNGQLQQQGGTKWYDEKGYRCAVMKRDGKPMSEHWVKFKNHPGMTFDVACPSAPDWRAQMLKICQDAKALGFQGFFYDQIGKQWPSACFDARHGHRPGTFVYTRDRETMLLDVIGSMRKVDPDFVLWSEAFNDTILDSVALYQGLFYVTDAGYNVANRFKDDSSCDMFPEMTFYVFPELVMCDRNNTPLCTRKRVNGGAVTNLRVDFEVRYRADRAYVERGEEPPEEAYANIVSRPSERALMKTATWRTNRDYLRCVSDFRRKHGAMLLAGTFKADEGFSVKGGKMIVANRWDGKNGETGILVWNADDKPANVSVEFGGRFILACEPERGEVDADEPIPPDTLRLYKYRFVLHQPQDAARVDEIRRMLRPEAGFSETRIGNREFWDKVAESHKSAANLVKSAREIAVRPMPVPDDSRYMEYEVWTRPLHECKANLTKLALAECLENKGAFLSKIVEYLEMFSTRRCWTGRYHDRNCRAFNGKIRIIELGNGQVAQDIAVVLDVLRERLPQDVRARAIAALRRNCLDTFLGIAKDESVAKANGCGWLYGYANWNAACCEYMVAAALHVLDEPQERAEAIELAERSIRGFLAGYTEDGLCLEGTSYWSYGFGQYLRLALWARQATGSFLSLVTPFSKTAYLSCYGSLYSDVGGPSYGDCNAKLYPTVQHLGALVWPEFDRFDARNAGYLSVGLSDFTLRYEEFSDPESFLAKNQKPFAYPLRSWYPAEIGQLVCRPRAGDSGRGSLYAAIQGGHNERPHGHHDIGSYCIAVDGFEVMGDPGNCKYGLDTFGPKRFENPMRNSFGHPVPKVDGHLQSKGVMSRAKVVRTAFSDERDFVEYDMKSAYREARNLVALARSLEYLRTEGRVVVTDKVAFDGRGRFETALTTFGKVEDIGGGSYRFSSLNGKVSAECKVSVKGAGWHLEKELLPESAGSQFEGQTKAKPLRVAIVLDEPVHEAEVRVTWEVARK